MKLYCGVDLHSTNGVYAVKAEDGREVLRKRLPNDLDRVLAALEPFRQELSAVAVESTYDWYWLVDGLMAAGYAVKLANPAAIKQYSGLKEADDDTDAAFLAELTRLGILPTGYIYPKEERPVRDLLRRRMLLVQQRTALILSLRNMVERHTGRRPNGRQLTGMAPAEFEALVGGNPW
jgi:transposase